MIVGRSGYPAKKCNSLRSEHPPHTAPHNSSLLTCWLAGSEHCVGGHRAREKGRGEGGVQRGGEGGGTSLAEA